MKVTNLAKRRKANKDRYRPVVVQKQLAEGLKQLRHDVENQGKGTRLVLVGGIYRSPGLDQVKVLNYPPWEIGYKVEPINLAEGFFKRTIYIKLKGDDILDVPEDEMEPVMGAIYQELLDVGVDMPVIGDIARDCIRVTQNFSVVFWHENSPGVVTPGGVK